MAEAKPRLSVGLTAALTLGLTAALMALRLGWIEPANPTMMPKGWAATPLAVMLALGMAVVIGLAWTNRGRLRAVLRPSRGRVIGAIVLALPTQVLHMLWIPAIGDDISAHWIRPLLDHEAATFALALLSMAVFWYPVSCLIVSGVGKKLARVAMFSLMVWAAVAAVSFLLGAQVFIL